MHVLAGGAKGKSGKNQTINYKLSWNQNQYKVAAHWELTPMEWGTILSPKEYKYNHNATGCQKFTITIVEQLAHAVSFEIRLFSAFLSAIEILEVSPAGTEYFYPELKCFATLVLRLLLKVWIE